MGILDNVKGLEDIVSGMGEAEKPKQKPKKALSARPDSLSNSRLEKIEDSVRSLKKAVEDVRNSVSQAEAQPFSEAMEKLRDDMEALRETVGNIGKGGGKSDNQDILRRLDEIDERIDMTVGEKIKSMEKMQDGEKRGFFGFKNDSEKRIDEAIKRMDKNLEIAGKKQEEIRAAVEERISEFEEMAKSSRKDNYSGDIELLKKSVAKIMADAKSAESRVSDIERAENIRDRQPGVKDAIANEIKDSMQHSIAGFKSGIDRHIEDAAKKIDETAIRIGKEQESIRRDVNEKLGAAIKRADERADNRLDELSKRMDGVFARAPEMVKPLAEENKRINERLDEFSKKIDSVRNDTAKMVSEAMKNVPKRDDIKKDIEEKINGKLAEFSRKVEEFSRYDLGKLKNVADAEKKIDENLKLFALNSDLEKVWKETENLKRYVDEKTKMADSLANSLRVWESRNIQVMEKEHDFDEKIKAFPELKLLEGRIRKTERALLELQKHFVAAQITEPIIME